MAKKILVTEKIAKEGLEALRKRGYVVDVVLDQTPDQLRDIIGDYHALIVRSGTQVDAEMLSCADNLEIIGRAGVTVDNIDI